MLQMSTVKDSNVVCHKQNHFKVSEMLLQLQCYEFYEVSLTPWCKLIAGVVDISANNEIQDIIEKVCKRELVK